MPDRRTNTTDLPAAVLDAVHALNNALGVLRLTADLLNLGAVDPREASRTVGEQVEEALQILQALRARVV